MGNIDFRNLGKGFIYGIIIFFSIVWLLFISDNSYLLHLSLNKEIETIESKIKYYEKEALKNHQEYKTLTTNKEALEKFAREQYLMKLPNEDIYYIKEDSLNNDQI